MRLSNLQQFILKEVFGNGQRCHRSKFNQFYKKAGEAEKKIITRSIERLIAKGDLVGWGHKTAEKWYTESVSLTTAGRKHARELWGKQQKLPLGK